MRNEYDRHIRLLEDLLDDRDGKGRLFRSSDEEEREPVSDFDQKEMQRTLKNVQTKRVKLNQLIQAANFEYKIDYEGEQISLAEALEVRKNLLADVEALAGRVKNAAYKRIIHKEERDIVRQPKHSFKETYDDYQSALRKLRRLINQIHLVNHQSTVKFKDE